VKVGIIGCGLIGKRRTQIASQSPSDEVVIVADIDKSLADTVATESRCQSTTDWQDVVSRDDLDIVVIATPNKFLMLIAVAALESGKHVLCEKPPGRNYTETREMVAAAKKAGKLLKVGFNHRHHPAIWKAHEVCSQGEIGPLMYGRAIYGHGGRPGYDKEWRADADLSGGGELLDQGVHIIDLLRWFMGDFQEVVGFVNTYHWDLGFFLPQTMHDTPSENNNPQLEDNAFAQLRTTNGQIAQLHTSWTQWKNRFSFEVFGRDGYVRIDGLGGSYGTETLTVGRRRPESGPPIEETFEFSGPDLSWQLEWEEFTNAIKENRQPLASGEESLGTMRTIAAIYESAHTVQIVRL